MLGDFSPSRSTKFSYSNHNTTSSKKVSQFNVERVMRKITLPRGHTAKFWFVTSFVALAACTTVPNSETQSKVTPKESVLVKAASDNPPRSILYVGNSFMYYNNSLHGMTNRLVNGIPNNKAASHRSTSLTISGSGIDWHDLYSYLRPDSLGRYSFVGDNEVRFNPPGRQYDSVILMDCSQCPVHPTLSKVFFE
jgi:hypothetical protein